MDNSPEQQPITPPNIDEKISQLADSYTQEKEQPKKRGRRSKLEIDAERQAKFSQDFAASAGAINMGIIALIVVIQENVPNWKEASQTELDTLCQATVQWVQLRANWIGAIAPELALVAAWGGYVIPRIMERRKHLAEKQPVTETNNAN